MAATAGAAAPTASTGLAPEADVGVMQEGQQEEEEEGDEVAALQKIIDDQNNEWMKYGLCAKRLSYTSPFFWLR